MLWLDGALIFGWIVGTALVVGGWVSLWLFVSARGLRDSQATLLANAYALSYTLIPLAGAGLFVGLSALPAGLAHGEGFRLAWLPAMRAALLALSAGWGLHLVFRRIGSGGQIAQPSRVMVPMALAIGGVLAAWWPFVFRGL